jgi:hypothetical protein
MPSAAKQLNPTDKPWSPPSEKEGLNTSKFDFRNVKLRAFTRLPSESGRFWSDEPCGIIVMLSTQSFHAWLTIAFGMARAMQR